MAKFHVNEENKPLPCRAQEGACPFQHFENLQEAQDHVEAKFEESTADPVLRKGAKGFAKDLQQRIDSLGDDPSTEDLIAVGSAIDAEVRRHLSFDPNDVLQDDLSQKQLDEIQTVNRRVMSELAVCSRGTDREITGPRAKDVESVVTVLPDGAKKLVSNDKIVTETIRKKSVGGQHSNGKLPVKVEFNERKNSFYEKSSGAPVGAFYENSGALPSDLEHPLSGSRVALRGESDVAEQYWMGKKPEGASRNLRKVSDKTELYVNGRKHVFEKPLYRFYTFENQQQTRLSVPAAKTEEGRAIITHEYAHAVQLGYHRRMAPCHDKSGGKTHEAADERMWGELRGNRKFSDDYRMMTYDGFPDDYMGSDKKEFFPKATEGVLHPASPSNKFLYGSDRHSNSDRVRQWTMAFWVHLDRITR